MTRLIKRRGRGATYHYSLLACSHSWFFHTCCLTACCPLHYSGVAFCCMGHRGDRDECGPLRDVAVRVLRHRSAQHHQLGAHPPPSQFLLCPREWTSSRCCLPPHHLSEPACKSVLINPRLSLLLYLCFLRSSLLKTLGCSLLLIFLLHLRMPAWHTSWISSRSSTLPCCTEAK